MDGAATIGAARDKVVFGTWSPAWELGYRYRTLPAMSWVGYAFFRLLGVGYWQANFISVVSSLFAIAFVGGFAKRQFGKTAALISVLFLAVNYVFIAYNRTPIVYTSVACAQTLVLHLWERGRRQPLWLAAAVFTAAASVLLLKVAALSIFPALAVGSWLVVKNGNSDRRTLFKLSSLMLLGVAVGFVTFLILVPDANFIIAFIQNVALPRTFNIARGFQENLRFAVQGTLQFGVYSSFFVRMFPLFLLSFGYLSFRSLEWLAGVASSLEESEVVALLYLLGTTLMLAYSRSHATRYMILLIPPMALVAGIAAERWLKNEKLLWPSRFGRVYPAFIQLALAFMVYHGLAALIKTWRAISLKTGFGDFRTILDVPILYTLVAVALLFGAAGTLWFLRQTVQKQQSEFSLPSFHTRVIILAGLVLFDVGANLYQYAQWADSPQYTLVNASREIGTALEDDAILGGDYAYPLALENNLRVFFAVPSPHAPDAMRDALRSLDYTHLAIGQDGSLLNNTPMVERLTVHFPEVMSRLHLIKTYKLRDNLVRIYEVER